MSGGLILASIIYAFALHNENALVGYFLVGGWQLISVLVHAVNKWFTNDHKRPNYHLLIAFTAIAVLVGFLLPEVLWIMMFILLFVSPFMALYYLRICYSEVYIKMQRPLAALK